MFLPVLTRLVYLKCSCEKKIDCKKIVLGSRSQTGHTLVIILLFTMTLELKNLPAKMTAPVIGGFMRGCFSNWLFRHVFVIVFHVVVSN